ncbi:DUF4143 domain-containing protein [Pseudactinotalea sp. HY160]|uniref:ATP-binding protein n=1 Tax=Pseudactinotalea sp. HY160 TaxID=2654490 RepID=UPI00128AF47A|nr:DUF4143 domain-containing protein [Pseudactinotalea sp. HY160]MPV51153.1 DUF4143 domain-containing protein [Pseudactinotalea sp. HY160]
MPAEYVARIVDRELDTELDTMGAVVIEGPKACGKTSTALQRAASWIHLDQDVSARAAGLADPRLLLPGPTPHLLDEWQTVPGLWNAVRHEVDDRGRTGQFILTGSSTPTDDVRRHSGSGRFGHISMRTLTLFESFRHGGVSLRGLMHDEFTPERCPVTITDYVDAIVRGGWPQVRATSVETAARFVRNYVRDAIEVDIPAITGSRRDPARMRRFFTAYAQVTSQTATLAAIARRVRGGEGEMARDTADSYRSAAERLLLVEDLPAWSPDLRSRTRLLSLPKRHLADPSLAVALLGADAGRLQRDGETLGFLFESLVTRDLRVYAQACDATVSHYRERDGDLECDLVVEEADGTWAGFEVKLGPAAIDTAASNLLRLASTRVKRPPAALVVVTTGQFAYQRDDGVIVVPLAALQP